MADNLLESISDVVSDYAKDTFENFDIDPVFGVHRLLEYKRQHLWVIYHNDYPSWLVTSAERPRVNLGSTKVIKFINTHEKFAKGQGEWEPIKITFHDPIAPSASKVLYDQIKKQWEYNKARVGYKSDYVIDNFQMRLLNPNGAVVETWILHDAFFTGTVNFSENTLDYDSIGRLKLSFMLDYSWAELITGGFPQ